MKIHIVDYGMGNIASVVRAFERLGCSVSASASPNDIKLADKLVLPGVGSFTQAMVNLNLLGLSDEIRSATLDEGTPLLGICLGMQLLADLGYEGAGEHGTPGLGIIPGTIRRLTPESGERIPHVGWNRVDVLPNRQSNYLKGIESGCDFYFVHSYFFDVTNHDQVLATTPYCNQFASVVGKRLVLGCQFHPEKSSKIGQSLLRNFVEADLC